MALQENKSNETSASHRRVASGTASHTRKAEHSLSLDDALLATRAIFRNNPEAAIASFLTAPPPALSSSRAIVEAAIPLMWCNKSTAEIATRLQIPPETLLSSFYSVSLYSLDVRAAIEHEVSLEGSKEISRILSELPAPDLSQFHAEWKSRLKRPTDSFLKRCEHVASKVARGLTFQEVRRDMVASQAALARIWGAVHSSVAEILADKATTLESTVQASWLKHWLPHEEWKFYAGRAKDRLTLRELGPRFDVSGEFARKQIQTLTDRFPPLRSLIHIQEISEKQRLALIAKREHTQTVRAERFEQVCAYLPTRTDVPVNMRELLKNHASRHHSTTDQTKIRCDLYLSITACFDSHPLGKDYAHYKHVIVAGLSTMSPAISDEALWIDSALTTAVELESKCDRPLTNFVLRRLFSHSIRQRESMAHLADDILTKVTEARATVAEAIGDLPRAKICLKSIQYFLSVCDSPRERVAERARGMYDVFLRDWDDMIKAGIPDIFAAIHARKALGRHSDWRTILKREIAPLPPPLQAMLRELGIEDPSFIEVLRSVRQEGEHSLRCEHLANSFFALLDKNYQLAKADDGTSQTFTYGSEITVRKLIKHAMLRLDESLFNNAPATEFVGYLITSVRLQLIAMGHFKR
jgi:hypothetical protein